MPLTVRSLVVDIRTDTPKKTDCFLIDTNIWFWLYYPRISLAPTASSSSQASCSNYFSKTLSVKASLYCYALSFSELSHNIEKTEREIYADQTGNPINTKHFRHDRPNKRLKIVELIADAWANVTNTSTLLDMKLNKKFMNTALTLFPSVGLDGYDLFMIEAARLAGITQILTDDGDYVTVPGITVFTSNPSAIKAANSANKLIVR